jgi:hypothetical protein
MERKAGAYPSHEKTGERLIHRQAVRWRCNLRPDAATMANTKSEAIAFFKTLLGVDKLPPEAIVEIF